MFPNSNSCRFPSSNASSPPSIFFLLFMNQDLVCQDTTVAEKDGADDDSFAKLRADAKEVCNFHACVCLFLSCRDSNFSTKLNAGICTQAMSR